MPNESGMISEETLFSRPPLTIGVAGLRRHRGEKVVAERDGRRYFGVVRDDGTALVSLSAGRSILKLRAMDGIYLPVNGRNDMYVRRYTYF